MKTQKYKIIPEHIAKTVTVAGYFEAFQEIVYDYDNGNKAYVALEEMRIQAGYEPRYKNYSTFRSCKSRWESNKTFTGDVKYI